MTDEERVWIHGESEFCKLDGENRILVQCPFCEEFGYTNDLLHEGCSCGADVFNEFVFSQNHE